MDKIEKLTKEQDDEMEKFADQEISRVNSGDTGYDVPIIVEIIDFLYETGKSKKEIPIIICRSPEDMFVAAAEYGYKKSESETIDTMGLAYDSGWVSYCEYMEKIGVDFSDIPEWATWKKIKQSGIWATLLFENMAFVCIRPSFVKTKSNGDLHCESGMAIQWIDGTGYYFLNGVPMEEHHVMTPAEKLDVNQILAVQNVEVRRELIRKIGLERFILKTGAKVLDKKGNYELLSVKLSDEVPDARYLKMKNPSINTWHVEGVEGNTVQEAINFRRGSVKDWAPSVLT